MKGWEKSGIKVWPCFLRKKATVELPTLVGKPTISVACASL